MLGFLAFFGLIFAIFVAWAVFLIALMRIADLFTGLTSVFVFTGGLALATSILVFLLMEFD